MSVRILITGSRLWTDKSVIAQALLAAIGDLGPHLIVPDGVGGYPGAAMRWDQITVVHGGARGADAIASQIATAWGMVVEEYRADWDRYGRSAGYLRNAEMVKLGADVMLAFPLGRSLGTRGCMRLAEAAGIPVRLYEQSDAVAS